MFVIIPYKACGEGIELRYAIRSLYKFFDPILDVVLVGDRPDWFRGQYIPVPLWKEHKEDDMMFKISFALSCTSGIDDFLYTNDDFFALQSFNEAMPNYYEHNCGYKAENTKDRRYIDMYNNCPPNWNNYDVHAPMIMDARQFHIHYECMDPACVMPIKTMYMNGDTANAEWLTDIKIRGHHNLAELRQLTKNRPFFSTHENSLNKSMLTFLQQLYPDASPCEKT